MNSFTIRFEGSLSLQDRDENGARSILIQNLRIYLPEEIERGLVPPASTAPCPPPSTSQELPNQEVPYEVQEKQEEVSQNNKVILTPSSIVTDDDDNDDDDTSQLTFQWSWSHTTPTSSSSSSSSSSSCPPPAPIKSKPNKENNPLDLWLPTPIKNKSSSKIPPSAPIKSKPNKEIDPFDFSSSSSSSSSSSLISSINHKSNEELFVTILKQFHMIPEQNPSRNPQNKQKDYHHFMFWHHFQHNGHSCDDLEMCMKEYIYNVISPCCLTESEDHDRQRCQTLEKIMKMKAIQFEPTRDYYVKYKNYLSKNENQPWRHNLNRYKLMDKFIYDTC